MKVFKFGGASVKDAAGVKNVARILQSYTDDDLLVVVSAMGKTTNALERILHLHHTGQAVEPELKSVKEYHAAIMRELFPESHSAWAEVEAVWSTLVVELSREYSDADMLYDQVVSLGEVISTLIVHHYLTTQKLPSAWIDARTYVMTDDIYREGTVDWDRTSQKISPLRTLHTDRKLYVTQGFIGSTPEGYTTTLGRDGSDFTAAIFAYCLDAESVTIWKDVPGIMNADPKRMTAVKVFDELPFREAAEMTYYGASVIHPKTIKPLATKGIPLYVKNFDDPSLPGTKIHECQVDKLPPLFVFKDNQCLISCKVTDYTFITEEHIRTIFQALSSLHIRINVMQNSAISFSFCIDFRESKIQALIQQLQHEFEVYYNTGLTLITVKNYDQNTFDTFRKRPGVILEQSSRSTLQLLVKPQQ